MRLDLLLILTAAVASDDKASLQAKLDKAHAAVKETHKRLRKRWDVEHYPSFLASAAMTHSAWELLKAKFQQKILAAHLEDKKNTSFVISFMGSSVTAGHDSPQNRTFPDVTGQLMRPSFEPLGVNLVTRNAAQGNNPCMPYDLCVRPFAGADADIVHWEQQFNCWDSNWNWGYEAFIRQAQLLPNKPIVVFAESSTPNWGEKDCQPGGEDGKQPPLPASHHVTPAERELLAAVDSDDPKKLATEVVFKRFLPHFEFLAKLTQSYKTAGGVQWFRSQEYYPAYKCLGPYHAKWGCCSASWHPSLLGHELRASHHTFHWLLVLQDALKDLTNKLGSAGSVKAVQENVDKHIEHAGKHMPTAPLYPSQPQITDGLQCLTDYEPRYERGDDLLSRVVGDSLTRGWKRELFEYLMPDGKNFVKINREKNGHLDRRWMLTSTKAKASGPLHINIYVGKDGPSLICAPPGEWGNMPAGYKNFWTVGTEMYLTENTGDLREKPEAAAAFSFDQAKAIKYSYTNRKPKDTQTVCVDFDKHFPTGYHVLSIVNTHDTDNIIIGLLLIA